MRAGGYENVDKAKLNGFLQKEGIPIDGVLIKKKGIGFCKVVKPNRIQSIRLLAK